jgi:hypothetical protein
MPFRKAMSAAQGCHLYFARRVTFLSCADTKTREPMACISQGMGFKLSRRSGLRTATVLGLSRFATRVSHLGGWSCRALLSARVSTFVSSEAKWRPNQSLVCLDHDRHQENQRVTRRWTIPVQLGHAIKRRYSGLVPPRDAPLRRQFQPYNQPSAATLRVVTRMLGLGLLERF